MKKIKGLIRRWLDRRNAQRERQRQFAEYLRARARTDANDLLTQVYNSDDGHGLITVNPWKYYSNLAPSTIAKLISEEIELRLGAGAHDLQYHYHNSFAMNIELQLRLLIPPPLQPQRMAM